MVRDFNVRPRHLSWFGSQATRRPHWNHRKSESLFALHKPSHNPRSIGMSWTSGLAGCAIQPSLRVSTTAQSTIQYSVRWTLLTKTFTTAIPFTNAFRPGLDMAGKSGHSVATVLTLTPVLD